VPEPSALGAATAFLEATVRVATPLALAAVGEAVTERSGVINVGLEGCMLVGALGGALGALWLGGSWPGALAGAAAGVLLAGIFAAVALGVRADQIVAGTAITIGAVGLTGAVYRGAFGATGAALSLPTFAPVAIPGLAAVPLVGPALFRQPAPTYVLYGMVAVVWLVLSRTRLGLAVRATGEAPEAAAAAGIGVQRLRIGATLTGGLCGGLAGASLVLAQAGTFAERMTAGRGFIAIAIVVLGRWHPAGVFVAALVFGAASALQYVFQAVGVAAPYQIFLMAPYVVSLLALAGVGGRARAPAVLGRAWEAG
jgi:simple sugar transport system permease protein